jgi:hypothetical protein
MNMIFYSPAGGKTEERLQKVIESVIPGRKRELCRTIDDLWGKLLLPKNNLAIALLLAEKQNDLVELVSMSNLFRNTRIILVAPDREKETVALAHRLRPRLLTYIDSDFADVFTVLTKIIADYHNPNGMGGG